MPVPIHKSSGAVPISKNHGLRNLGIELTFDVDPSHPKAGHQFEVNIMGFEFIFDANNKPVVPNMDEHCFVFEDPENAGFRVSTSGGTTHEADGGSIGDDKMSIFLDKINASPAKIVGVDLYAEIYEGFKNGHTFADFTHCTFHVVNLDTGEHMFDLPLDKDERDGCLAHCVRLLRQPDDHWTLTNVSQAYKNKGVSDALAVYGLAAADEE
jgi:tellurium resistance protein TerD